MVRGKWGNRFANMLIWQIPMNIWNGRCICSMQLVMFIIGLLLLCVVYLKKVVPKKAGEESLLEIE